MLAAMTGITVWILPPEVNSWAYVVGAEHQDTFNPVSYREACGGLPARTGGGCRMVTEATFPTAARTSPGAARWHSATRSVSATRCGPGVLGEISTLTLAAHKWCRTSPNIMLRICPKQRQWFRQKSRTTLLGSLCAPARSAARWAASPAAAAARGAARGASRLKTKIEQRSGDVPGSAEEVSGRLTRAFPKAEPLPAGDHVRPAVPVGITGLQQIIVDAEFSPVDATRVHIELRGFGKEGLISRKPTRTVTDQAWAAVTSSSG